MNFVLNILMVLMLGRCALAENIQKEERKDYFDQVHEVELADYEFEERLNSFYESEPMANADLYDLYEGEFPEGERNPKNLRIHWKDARELALAELELQKPIQENWNDAAVSERPILVLDRAGGDFYRYYEFRVIKDQKFLGAVRIPAYRRTENFATAEVHVYSDDEKTYTVRPTGWGRFVASKVYYSSNTDLFRSIQQQVSVIMTDNMIYNMSYYLYGAFNVDHKIPEVSTYTAYSKLTNIYMQDTNKLVGFKGSLNSDERIFIVDAAARKDTYKLQKELTDIQNYLFRLESIIPLIGEVKPLFLSVYMNTASNLVTASVGALFQTMETNIRNSSFQEILKEIYWIEIEQKFVFHKMKKDLWKDLLNRQWELGKLFSEKNINPVIEYNNFHKYPQRKSSSSHNFQLAEYTLIEPEKHAEYIDISVGFELNDQNIRTSVVNSIQRKNFELQQESISLNSIFSVFEHNVQMKQSLHADVTRMIDSEALFKEFEQTGINIDLNDTLEDVFGRIKELEPLFLEIYNTIIAGVGYSSIIGITGSAVIGSLLGATVGGSAFGASLIATGPVMLIISAVVKDKVHQYSDKVDAVLVKITDLAGGTKPLDKMLSFLDTILPSNIKNNNTWRAVTGILYAYIDNGPGVIARTFRLLFDSWSVWVIPILPFPTWVHYTDKWGMIPDWQYALGVPNVWSINMDNIVSREQNPKEIVPPPAPIPKPIQTVPEGLEDYSEEWHSVQEWIRKNGILDTDNNGSFIAGTEQQLVSIINYMIEIIKETYLDKIALDYITGEYIENPGKERLDKALEDRINLGGREYIHSILGDQYLLVDFKWHR